MGAVRRKELVIERGEDVWVWDDAGKRYLDATASLWYCNVGHGRPEIAAAVAAQFKQLEAYSAFGDFVSPVAHQLAGTLADLAPMPARIFLTCGGGESIDTAAKIAQRYWSEQGQPDRTLLISRTSGYHGTNGYGTALAGIPANREGFGPQIETMQVPHDSLEAVAAAIEGAGAERVAAVFVEPVIGAGGVHPPLPGYLEGLAEICKRSGVLFVADSVICGFGRLGSWFGVERFGIEPDMITFAKGVTSGYLPLGGVVVAEHVAEPFWHAPGGPMLRHGATYAAHAACCAAAIANIELLGRDGLLTRGRELEGVLHDTLKPLASDGKVAEVRGGVGTMAAVELSAELLDSRPAAIADVVMAAREQGVLVRGLGRGVAVSPPLTATAEHFGIVHDALAQALSGL
jgi:putrescine aminotransferase